mmetsp:Transcript_80400/g.206923  ORF Transcript_80400/g.206923 Transcript_80400/m.206923 type:complete len:343 (-) Transcript_80400:90-1118(-)
MRTSAPALRSATCSPFAAPPKMQTARAPTACVNFWASAWICCASSRVGASTRTCGRAGPRSSFLVLCFRTPPAPRFPMRTSAGRRKPQVLPLPVFATATTSSPWRASGHACAWIGVGSVYPCSLRAAERRSPSSGSAAAKVSQGGGHPAFTTISCALRYAAASWPSAASWAGRAGRAGGLTGLPPSARCRFVAASSPSPSRTVFAFRFFRPLRGPAGVALGGVAAVGTTLPRISGWQGVASVGWATACAILPFAALGLAAACPGASPATSPAAAPSVGASCTLRTFLPLTLPTRGLACDLSAAAASAGGLSATAASAAGVAGLALAALGFFLLVLGAAWPAG